MIAQRPGEREREEREREREVSARGTSTYCGGAVLLQGRGEKVVGDLPAVRTIAPDATIRPYYLASIATSAESNNVANSGGSWLVRHARPRICRGCGICMGR